MAPHCAYAARVLRLVCFVYVAKQTNSIHLSHMRALESNDGLWRCYRKFWPLGQALSIMDDIWPFRHLFCKPLSDIIALRSVMYYGYGQTQVMIYSRSVVCKGLNACLQSCRPCEALNGLDGQNVYLTLLSWVDKRKTFLASYFNTEKLFWPLILKQKKLFGGCSKCNFNSSIWLFNLQWWGQ
jgi:hypothetical protein